MAPSRRFLVFAAVILPAMACQAAARLVSSRQFATDAVPTPSYAASDTPQAASCPVEAGMILRAANSESIPLGRFPAIDTSVSLDIPLVTYHVSGDELSNPVRAKVPKNLIRYQNDLATQQDAWRLFVALIPGDQRSMLDSFQVMTDGPGGVLSAVEQTTDDPARWILETDIADIPDTKNLTFTLLHEFAHLMTLGPKQVPPDWRVFKDPHNIRVRDRAIAACPSFFPGEGCSLPASYINAFFNRFWTDLFPEWSAIDRLEEGDEKDARLDAFYRKHHDDFVDSYAVTSPVEDIAESWSYFILSPRPAGASIRDQKLDFFYGYAGLVTLRSTILSNLCAANP